MKALKSGLAAVLVGALVAGCTTTGMGMGRSRTGTATALFSWKQEGARSGRMAASLDKGQVYVGPFFPLTSETRVEELDPLWLAGPGGDHRGPDTAFVTHHGGTVVANLNGPDGHMRCRFQLTRPTAGMAGGGGGRCLLPDGTTIGATFPPLGWPG